MAKWSADIEFDSFDSFDTGDLEACYQPETGQGSERQFT
jgi:hypothetical protein